MPIKELVNSGQKINVKGLNTESMTSDYMIDVEALLTDEARKAIIDGYYAKTVFQIGDTDYDPYATLAIATLMPTEWNEAKKDGELWKDVKQMFDLLKSNSAKPMIVTGNLTYHLFTTYMENLMEIRVGFPEKFQRLYPEIEKGKNFIKDQLENSPDPLEGIIAYSLIFPNELSGEFLESKWEALKRKKMHSAVLKLIYPSRIKKPRELQNSADAIEDYRNKNDWMGFITMIFFTHILQSNVELSNGKIVITPLPKTPVQKSDPMPEERNF